MRIPCDNDKLCIGCSACSLECPHKAIKMEFNAEGFLMPIIDESLCSDCGNCRSVCPVHAEQKDHAQHPRCFAAYGPDEVRLGRSASGGIFPVLAEKILMDGGVVCGAAWNENWECQHIIINSGEELWRLQNSKYVQSDIRGCLPKIREFLDSGRKVLFSGTPCQVAAVNSYLRKKYRQLFTVDIVCHGVPSPIIWKKYLEENFDISQIRAINFRDKRKGWKGESFLIDMADGRQYQGGPNKDPYFSSFLRDVMLRKCCGTCKYCGFPRQGDLTIGDYWGIDDVAPELNDGKGISVILENSVKGTLLLDSVKTAFPVFRELALETAYSSNYNIVRPSNENEHRESFFQMANRKSVTEALGYYGKDTSECKIINYWYALNYGAVLTCYALQEMLLQENVTVKVINYVPPIWADKFSGSFSESFGNKHLNLTRRLQKNELETLNAVTDTFITGSDQVFNYSLSQSEGGTMYQLSFVSPTKRRLAFSASFGRDHFEAPALDRNLFWLNLEQFSAISVRERSGVQICAEEGIDAEHILDPVLGIEREKWESLAESSEEDCAEGGILYFALPYLKNGEPLILNTLSELLHSEITVQNFDEKRSPEAWLNSIRKARFVVTDSFHGTCFCIIFHKPFLVLGTYKEGLTRITELLSQLHLEKCCPQRELTKSEVQSLIESFDWDSSDKILAEERLRMKEWIRCHLKAPIPKGNHSAALLSELLEENKQMKALLNSQKKKTRIKLFNSESQLVRRIKIFVKYSGYKMLSKIAFGKLRKHCVQRRFYYSTLLKKENVVKKLKMGMKYYGYKIAGKITFGKIRKRCNERYLFYKEKKRAKLF